MTLFVKLIHIIFITLLFLTCAPPEEEAELIGSYDQVDMSTVRWNKNSFPLKMSYSKNHEDETDLILEDVMQSWEQGNTIDFFAAPEQTDLRYFTNLEDYYKKDKEVMGIYLVNIPINKTLDDYLALTQIFIQKTKDEYGHSYYEIIHGDIIINGAKYTFSNDPDDFSTYYYKTLITHELGHILGIPHLNTGIMATGMSKKDNETEITNLEYDYLYDKYKRTPASASSKDFHAIEPNLYKAIFYIKAAY